MTAREWNPSELLEISGFFWQTCVLHAAVKMDVFSVIGDGELTAVDIAGKVDGVARGVVRLLDALVAMELLLKQNETYANSASGRELLAKDSPRYLGHIIRHHHHLLESWSNLDQAVISGRPQRDRSSYSQEQWRESFLMGMFNLAMGLAPRIVPVIDVSDRQHLLDLVGGPGTYAIHLNNSMDGPLFPALFSLNMLLGTESGQSYSEAQITDMLAGAGASDIRRIPIESPNHSGILVGFV